MAKHALAHARNLELRAAIGVGTGHQGVGYRPIGLPQRTLLCGGTLHGSYFGTMQSSVRPGGETQ